MVTATDNCMVLRWETALQCDLNLLFGAANYWKPWAIGTSLLLYMKCCILATLLTPKGISLQLACPCQGASLGKGWLHAVCSSGKAGCGWHHPTAQPRQPVQGAALQHRSVNSCSFQTDKQEYCISSGGMGPAQVLSDYKQHSWSAVSKGKTEFVWLHSPKNQTWSPSWSSSSNTSEHSSLTPLSEAAHQFWSDLASQNLRNM